MTRKEFNDFIYSIERSPKLRRKVRECENKAQLIELAAEFGFLITFKDLSEDSELSQIEQWFQISKIPPIKIRNQK